MRHPYTKDYYSISVPHLLALRGPPGQLQQLQDLQEHLRDIQEHLQDHFKGHFEGF